jgi:hypothetical protein
MFFVLSGYFFCFGRGFLLGTDYFFCGRFACLTELIDEYEYEMKVLI